MMVLAGLPRPRYHAPMTRRIHPIVVAFGLLAATAPVGAQPSTPAAQYPNLRIGGFSDFDFRATNESTDGATSGFHEGQFVLHLTSVLAPRFSFFGEVSINARAHEFTTEIERTILKFQANDMLGMSFGRYHTPINWWNVAFHHGQWLQTTINRPQMTRFGGDFIPVHFVGAVANGTLPAPRVDLDYEAGVGNGRSAPVSRAGDAGDTNNHRAWFGTLAARPDLLYRLEVGVAYYDDLVGTATDGEFDEQIVSAHAVWTRETPELIGEVAFSRHEGRSVATTYDNWAYYVQAAYRLPWWGDDVKPYARFEQLDIDDGDPVFAGGSQDLREYTAGLRWDCSDFVALKGEYRRQDYEAVDIDALLVQISFAF